MIYPFGKKTWYEQIYEDNNGKNNKLEMEKKEHIQLGSARNNNEIVIDEHIL